jgi:hypothetical protein
MFPFNMGLSGFNFPLNESIEVAKNLQALVVTCWFFVCNSLGFTNQTNGHFRGVAPWCGVPKMDGVIIPQFRH